MKQKIVKKGDVGFENLRLNLKIYLCANPRETIFKLSKRSGISHTSLYQFMSRNRGIGSTVIEKLCRFFNMEVCEIFARPTVFLEKIMEKKKSEESGND